MKNFNHHKDNSFEAKVGIAEMLKGGVIMQVTSPEEARIAEDAGAVAVVALGETPKPNTTLLVRMTDPEVLQRIQEAVSIPVMAECRIGHFVEAQILEALFVDFIVESKYTTAIDDTHIMKKQFKVPFVSYCSELSEALRRVEEGAACLFITEDCEDEEHITAIPYIRKIAQQIRSLKNMSHAELVDEARSLSVSCELLEQVARSGKLPVPVIAGGGLESPADVAYAMILGAEGVFLEESLFYTDDPMKNALAIVSAVHYYRDPELLAKISMGLLNPEDQPLVSGIDTLFE